MNEERLSYRYGYLAVGTVRGSAPQYDISMAPYIEPRKLLYTFTPSDEIRYRENRKAWFDGYLDRSLELGGTQAQKALEVYRHHYPLSCKPETVNGKTYILFFEQLDTYKWNESRNEDDQILKKVPLPIRRIDVNADSFSKAIRQAWSTIAADDTSLLASVTMKGAYLPINSNDPQKNLLYRYYNAVMDVDTSKQRLLYPRRQFLREVSNGGPTLTDIVKQEQKALAGYKAVEKNVADIYKDITGKRPMPTQDIFLIGYVEDTVREMPESQEKTDLQNMLDFFEYNGNRDRLAAYVCEGVMPNGDICTENIPIWEWNLHDEYFLSDQNGWSPIREDYIEVQNAVCDAKAGNMKMLTDLLSIYRDMRPLAQYADELVEAGCMEAVDMILSNMERNRVPHANGYLTLENRIELDKWRASQQLGMSSKLC